MLDHETDLLLADSEYRTLTQAAQLAGLSIEAYVAQAVRQHLERMARQINGGERGRARYPIRLPLS